MKLYVKLNVLYIVIFGGRGRVRTGRRGKTVKFTLCNICIYYWRKGPCENRQKGEDGDNFILVFVYIYMLFGGRGRVRTGRRGKTVKIILCV